MREKGVHKKMDYLHKGKSKLVKKMGVCVKRDVEKGKKMKGGMTCMYLDVDDVKCGGDEVLGLGESWIVGR